MSILNVREVNLLFPPPRDKRACHLVRYANESWQPGLCYDRESNPLNALIFVHSGTLEFTTPAVDCEIKAGGLCTFGPTHPHRLAVKDAPPVELTILTFQGKEADALLSEHFGGTGWAHTLRAPERVVRLLNEIELAARYAGPHAATAGAHLLMALLLCIHEDKVCYHPAEGPTRTETRFLKCKHYVDQHYLTLASAKDAAAANNITHVHLCRLFKENLGQSPHQYLLRRKMDHIASTLTGTTMTLDEIAETYGFADAYSLSKTFKRVTGSSPRAYRRATVND